MSAFAGRVVAWQRRFGRHDLPWQRSRDAYRIWISEIMLQQTQVGAVIPYYERFLARFPDVGSLASASSDEVMGHWSGLGYYARARNLHRAAREIVESHSGEFPRTAAAIAELPGVGRSTASAVAVFAFGERAAILDGNVKRVLARAFAVEGWPGAPAVERRLWTLAETLLPAAEDIVPYTQGLMDLGSMVCVRARPLCGACPLEAVCEARRAGAPGRYPTPRPASPRPVREAVWAVVLDGGSVLLERRPPAGIWGGLWSLPEIEPATAPAEQCLSRFGISCTEARPLTSVEHGFTHFTLRAIPWLLNAPAASSVGVREDGLAWWPLSACASLGLPAPVRRLLVAVAAEAGALSPD
jgi:A/G-specific adenine glycosylase